MVCVASSSGTGLWYDTMVTLTMTLVATVLVMVLAVVLGVWMGRSRRPTWRSGRCSTRSRRSRRSSTWSRLALFGASRFTAIVAAVAYARPIAIKLVADGIRGVSPDDRRGGPVGRHHERGR